MTPEKLIAGYWKRVERPADEAACWSWRGEVRQPAGFGVWNKRLAHLWAWELAGHAVPENMAVRHACGNKTCVNPAHLRVGKWGKTASPRDERFWKYVSHKPTEGCWLWEGGVHTSGYGRIGNGGKGAGMEYAHRASWEMHHGQALPEHAYVAHTCDHKLCVRPEHLFVSDGNVQNMADAASKHRIAHGERSARHVFRDTEIQRVRALLSEGRSHREAALLTGISRTHVTNIANGKARRREVTVALASEVSP